MLISEKKEKKLNEKYKKVRIRQETLINEQEDFLKDQKRIKDTFEENTRQVINNFYFILDCVLKQSYQNLVG